MKRTIQYLFLGILLLSTTTLNGQDKLKNDELDTLNWINKDVHSFHMTKLSLLGMDTVRNGYDSLRIRIFVNPTLGKPDRVIQLSLKNEKWKGVLINYNLLYDDKEKSFYIEKIKKRKLKPKSGWNAFMNDLINNGLLSLPDEGFIKNYPTIIDGVSFCAQISMSNEYRFYCYSNPGVTKKEIKEAESMDYIIRKIYNELKINKKKATLH